MTQNTLKLAYRPRDCIAALGSKSLYERCVLAKWIVPVIRKHKLVLFDSDDVARCWKRIKSGELPSNDKEAVQQ